MSSAVLPSGPAADFSGARDASSPKNQPRQGDSSYDQVSRQEEARLSRRQAEDRRTEAGREADRQQSRDAARDARDTKAAEAKESRQRDGARDAGEKSAEKNVARGADKTERPGDAGKRSDSAKTGDSESPETTRIETADGRVVEVDAEQLELLADELSMSLEELQSVLEGEDAGAFLAVLMQGPAAQSGVASGGVAPAPLTDALDTLPGSFRPVPGTTAGAAPGDRDSGGLTERMLSQLASATAGSAEGNAKTAEAPLSGSRFQGTLEMVSQPLAQNAAGKGNELASPLRSYATTVDLPVGQAQWGDKVMGKLAWLTSQKMSAAEIHLTPPDLGPMEVRVQVQNEQASVTVHAANPAVRDQLELHSQRLRDMLSEQGLGLEKFDVSDQAAGDGGGAGDSEDSTAASGRAGGLSQADESDPDNLVDAGQLDLSWKGEVDLYA